MHVEAAKDGDRPLTNDWSQGGQTCQDCERGPPGRRRKQEMIPTRETLRTSQRQGFILVLLHHVGSLNAGQKHEMDNPGSKNARRQNRLLRPHWGGGAGAGPMGWRHRRTRSSVLAFVSASTALSSGDVMNARFFEANIRSFEFHCFFVQKT